MVGRRVAGEGRHRDGADRHDGEVGDQPFRPALGDQRDAVAGGDAERRQAARQPLDLRGDLAVAQRTKRALLLVPQEGFVAEPFGLREEQSRQAWPGALIHRSKPLSTASPWREAAESLYRWATRKTILPARVAAEKRSCRCRTAH
jgi:hypothetical protein